MDTVIRSSSSLQDASVSGPALRRQREHFTPCVRTPRGLNGSQQLREPPQNCCCRSRTAGGRVRGSFLLKPVASGGVSSHIPHSVTGQSAQPCPGVCWLSRSVRCSTARSRSRGDAWGILLVLGLGRGCRQAVPWDQQCARPSAPRHLGLSLPQT